MRAYIYCTKAKPYLRKDINDKKLPYFLSGLSGSVNRHSSDSELGMNLQYETECCETLNGKIVASFELNTIESIAVETLGQGRIFYTDTIDDIEDSSCLKSSDLDYYFNSYDKSKGELVGGYAWHIDDLYILDKPMELSEFASAEIKSELKKPCMNNFENPFLNALTTSFERIWEDNIITKAPQSWCYAYDSQGNRCIIISIKPEWVEKILNGEKTIEIRKTYPKEVGLSE